MKSTLTTCQTPTTTHTHSLSTHYKSLSPQTSIDKSAYLFSLIRLNLGVSHEVINQCVAVIFSDSPTLIIALVRVKKDLLRHLVQLLSLPRKHKFEGHFLICVQVLFVWPQIIQTPIFVAPLRDVFREKQFLPLIQLPLEISVIQADTLFKLMQLF